MDRGSTRTCIDAFERTLALAAGFGPALGRGLEGGRRGTTAPLATAGLVVVLLCTAAQEAPAQSGTVAGLALANDANLAAVAIATQPTAKPGPAPDPSMIRRVQELDALLAVRGGRPGISARQTDQALAAAVARGSVRDLEKRSGFKRHSDDLFRTQRALQVGDQEMLLRLRLRAKKRDTMSVELRF
ncbi:MAG: hypothetical protein R3F35_19080 [Myxococcota bacterium]